MKWRWILLAAFVIAVAAGCWIFYRIETWPRRTAEDLRAAFAQLFPAQPKITVSDRVFYEQSRERMQLVLVSRQMQVEREIQHEWLGSTKRIKLRGVYDVKAGFDLATGFSVEAGEKNVRVNLPEPAILGVEQVNFEILAFENGVWNRINPADLEGAVKSLNDAAKDKAHGAGIEGEAATLLESRMRQQMGPRYKIELWIQNAAGSPGKPLLPKG